MRWLAALALTSCFQLDEPPSGGDGPPGGADAPVGDGSGCVPTAGRPSVVPMLQENAALRSPRLSADGFSLYYVAASSATVPGALRVSRRFVHDDPFQRSAPVSVGEALATSVQAVAVAPNGLILSMAFASGGSDLFFVQGSGEAFSPAMPLAISEPTSEEIDPFLSADGLELLFVSNRGGQWRILRSLRGGVNDPFNTVETLEVPESGDGQFAPFLGEDGMALYFTDEEGRPLRAPRLAPGSITFGAAEIVASLAAPGSSTRWVYLSPTTGEVWFASDRAWRAGPGGSIWRAQYCSCGDCRPEPEIACGGTRSADGRTCYQVFAEPKVWPQAVCPPGSHLVSVHGDEENDLVFAVMPAGWLGLERLAGSPTWVWTSGEPASFLPWRPLQPDPDTALHQCATIGIPDGSWDDLVCDANSLGWLCETQIWPWW